MIILGLNAFHADSAAALVRDGRLIAAAEEERFRRIKHWAGFPQRAIEYCLAEAGIEIGDVDHVAINQDSKANLLKKMGYLVLTRPRLEFVLSRLRHRHARATIESLIKTAFPSAGFCGQMHHVEHHLAHLSSAFHVSPFDDATVVSIDGFGDFASTAWGVGHGNSLSLDGKVYFPHSLGIFYEALTQYLGFPHYGDEYKVMGLAPYGEPKFLDEMQKIVRLKRDGTFELDLTYFVHHREELPLQWADGPPQVADLFSPALEKALGPRRRAGEAIEARHRDIARSVQAMYEQAFFHLLTSLHQRQGLSSIVIAGGCAANSVANGKIRRMTPFRRVYVQAAPADAGGAIGGAFSIWHKLGGERSFVMDHAFWGPAFDTESTDHLISEHSGELELKGCNTERFQREDDLCARVATAIADGKVVGWFQGRMEWGPRALGNRSIVCDPRRADMKAILNAKIKRRESFRPFAPSVLDHAVAEWFEEDDDVPFMMQVFQIRADKRGQIPAVTHVDGSGRLQTVHRETNPRYFRLIEAFAAITGVPMVLNTSFNENEPVVCRPEEALDCFLRTAMDMLVLGDTVIERAVVETDATETRRGSLETESEIAR